jgi:hypothetical protein
MAHQVERFNLPFVAASAVGQYVPVTFQSPSAQSETVIRAGSVNDDVLGMSIATVATPGYEIAVAINGVVKGLAGASMGAGARVGVGCVNGILVPLGVAGMSTAGGSALGALGLRFSVGRTLKNAVAGDFIPVLLQPEQVI